MRINNKKLTAGLFSFILIRIIFFVLNRMFDIYFLVFNINQSAINLIINILIIVITTLILNNKFNKRTLKYIINFISLISIGVLLFINLIFNEKSYFYFESPNKSHTLVIEEDSIFLLGQSKFYERKGLIFIEDLNSEITTDDGYRPFSNNRYNLKWMNDNSVELEYDNGTGSEEYKKIIIKFN